MSIFFQGQGTEFKISSGNKTNDFTIPNCQGISVNYQLNRQENTYVGNFSPEDEKQIINYTPIQVAFSYLNSESKLLEENLGLLNPSGCFININKSNNINDYSSRDYKILFRPANSQNYAGQINLTSGYLGQYNISASVGSPVSSSVSLECLDIESISNNTIQSGLNQHQIVSTENTTITGINFSGFGVSGLQINNFSIGLTIQWNNVFKIGQKFPEKTIIDTKGEIQINGVLNNITEAQKLSTLNYNSFYNGNINLKLKTKCLETEILDILIKKPYIESRNINIQAGNFTTVSLNLSTKPTIKPSEFGKSNIIFS